VSTIYKDRTDNIQDNGYNIQRQGLKYTKTMPTIYKDSPYNIQRQSLQYTKRVPTIYNDRIYII
jgi:hypothetical protein